MKLFKNQQLLVGLVLLVALPAAFAVERSDLRGNSGLLPQLQKHSAAAGIPADLHAAFGLAQGEQLQLLRTNIDADGTTHSRYRQTLRGVPVWGEQIVVSRERSGNVRSIRGALIKGLAAELNQLLPAFGASRALSAMKTEVGKRLTRPALFRNESVELVIYLDNDRPVLSYAVSFFADVDVGGEPTRPTFLVDAIAGNVLFEYEGLTHSKVGTGPGGNEKIGQYEYGTSPLGYMDVSVAGSTYTMSNGNVKTVDLNHGTSGSTAYSYSGPRNTRKAINGAYSPLNDAHYFGGVVYDMYNHWVGVAPLTFQLTMRVHYSRNYENAFWDGATMTFGDGYTTFYPLVSLDVSAHEVSHGFTEQSSGLIYASQSGGINESFSDIAGEAAENYMHGSNDYLVGADIFKSNGALRYMANPPLDGRSIGNAGDYYEGLDVHYSSGVFNKAFYTLATSSGWNVQDAFKVFARANQLYWTPSATFRSAAIGVTDAAHDLEHDVQQVAAAFTSVGVDTGPLCSSVTPLTNGSPVEIKNADAGDWNCYSLDVPGSAGQVTFDLAKSGRGRGGDADLYVKLGTAPDTVIYDCRSTTTTSNESCAVSPADPGIWYVGVYAYSAYPAVILTGSYPVSDTSGGTGGTSGTDADGDGYFTPGDPEDCDDTNANIYPGHPDSGGRWGRDGVDNDCDGIIDG